MTIAPHNESHLLLIPEKLGGGNFAKLKAFPGFTRWAERNLVVRTTGANLDYLLREWPEAEWLPGADPIRRAHEDRAAQALLLREQKASSKPLRDGSGYHYLRAPMAHQERAFLLSRDAEAFGLFMEQGTGKTKVTIDTACYLYQQGKIDCLLIVAWPNGVHQNWIEYELPLDMSVPYRAEAWSSNHATLHRRVAFRKVHLAPRDAGLKVFAFNVEAFASDDAREAIVEILERHRCLFIIDQSASIKNPQAKRTKFLIKVSPAAPFRRVLDGAPVAEGADELYSQFKFLDPRIIGHDTWTGFKAEYCEIGWFKEIKGYKNLDQLREKIDPYSFRVLADDCLDLPARVYKTWAFDLGKEERRIFDELRAEGLAYFSDLEELDENYPEDFTPTLEAHLALVKNLRLQQIASGWWPADNRTSPIEEGNPSRAKALLTLLQAAPGKALIFSRFRADIELIKAMLGKEAVTYYGGTSEEERAEAKRRFMNDPRVLYLIGQPRSAGIGHTLTAAKHVIFYSNDPSLRLREECEKRVHRKGLTHAIIVWDLVARGTHDLKIMRALREKKELANVIMQDPENFFLQSDED